MGKDFFIADTHFGSESIIRYENRPFGSIEDMDRILIEKWNSVVSEEDNVYILGDFSVYEDIEKDEEILKLLNGSKILIMGNHDTYRGAQTWREAGFSECSRWPILYKNFFILSHEPLYMNSNMPYVNIYGHVHGNASYRDVSPQSACVSVERIDYTPVEFGEIMRRIKNLQ